jgi:two-component system, OmpR family, phosphate regulon response regulator PhoB
MGTRSKVLIVEWNTSDAEALWGEIQQAGHETVVAFSIERATLLISQEHPQAMLIRWRMPDGSVLSLINDLRRDIATSRLPIIVLGEPGASDDECIRALDEGANDYVRRPYRIHELIARIGVALRPVEYPLAQGQISIGLLTVDLDAMRASARMVPGAEEVDLQLNPTTFRLLRFFAENTDKVLSRKKIIDHVWFGRSVHEGIVDGYVALLRAKLQPLQESLVIQTVRGAGFRLSSGGAMPGSPHTSLRSLQARKRPVREGQRHTNTTRNAPVLVPDLNAAIEKIQRLKELLHEVTEENHYLRNTIDAPRSSASDDRGKSVPQRSEPLNDVMQ